MLKYALFFVISLFAALRIAHASSVAPDIALDQVHGCAILNGRAYCWGNDGGWGRLGRGPRITVGGFQLVPGLPTPITQIASGPVNSCAIHNNNALYCWGNNDYRQLLTTTHHGFYPILLPGFENGTTRVAVGDRFVCAIRNGGLYCWGNNSHGQIGNGEDGNSVTTPHQVFSDSVTAVAAGHEHACAIRSGALYCWGRNTVGQLGLGVGHFGVYTTPQLVPGFNSGVSAVVAMEANTCAVRSGDLHCWGENLASQTGGPHGPRVYTPTLTFNAPTQIASRCLISGTLGSGDLYCWSLSQPNAAGTGLTGYASPTAIPFFNSPTRRALATSHGWYSHAAKASDGCIYVWGLNSHGQLGLPPDASEHPPRILAGSCLPGVSVTKTAPANGSNGHGGTVTLRWNVTGSSSVDHYRYAITTSLSSASFVSAGRATHATVSGLSGDTTYYWQVRACADPDCTIYVEADGGRWYTFTTAVFPTAFNKTAPNDGQIITATSTTLAWNPAGGTVHHYRYCIATTSGCTPGTSVGLSTSVAVMGLSSGTTYYWQVRACADLACNDYTDASGGHWRFHVFLPPGSFAKSSPDFGATDQPLALNLTWNNTAGAHHYRYCIATTASACTLPGNIVTSTSVAISGLSPGTTYYWQVRACAEPSCTSYRDADGGDLWSFTTLPSPPGSFQKVSPSNSSTGHGITVTFAWDPASDVDHYQLCLVPAHLPCTFSSVGPVTSTSMGGLSHGVAYRWQVRACANRSCTVYSDADGGTEWTFVVAAPPDRPLLIAPPNDAGNLPANVVLRWSHSGAGVDHYRYCLSATFGCTPSLSTGALTEAGIGPLSAATTYHWQVRACANSSCSVYADSDSEWRFSTAALPAPFTKTMPISGAAGLPSALNLHWQAAIGVDHYRVCYDQIINNACNGAWTSVPSSTLSFAISGLAQNTTYEWQVIACAVPDCSISRPADSGSFHRFTTASIPNSFTKQAPISGAVIHTTAVVLSWTTASGAHHYRYCLTTDNACIPTTDVGTSTGVTISNLSPGITYYWQVRACADLGCTIFRDADDPHYHFHVASLPFGKLAPSALSAVVPTGTTLRWSPSAGASAYRYCLWRIDEPPCATSITVPATQTQVAVSGLASGVWYRWQVFACFLAGCLHPVEANGGSPWEFRTMSPVEVISSTASLAKALLTPAPRFGQRVQYAIVISNPLSTTLALTVSEVVPSHSQFVARDETGNAVYQGIVAGAPTWRVTLPAFARAVITPTIVHGIAGVADLQGGRRVTTLTHCRDDSHLITRPLGHNVQPNRLFLPTGYSECLPFPPPDMYEPDDDQRTAKVLRLAQQQARTFHSANDVDVISSTLTFTGIQTFTFRIDVESWTPGVQLAVSSPSGSFDPVTTTLTMKSGSYTVHFVRPSGYERQDVQVLLTLNRAAAGNAPCGGRYTVSLNEWRPFNGFGAFTATVEDAKADQVILISE